MSPLTERLLFKKKKIPALKATPSSLVKFTADDMDKGKELCGKLLWADKTQIDLLQVQRNVVSAVKHDGGSIMLWSCS